MAKKVFPVAIVGAGIHGTAVTVHLLASRVPRESIVLIDEKACCKAWDETTSNMGMTHMRSPWEHYLAGHGPKLRDLARTLGMADSEFTPNPPLKTFNRYSALLIYNYRIEDLRTPAKVLNIERAEDQTFILELNTQSRSRNQKIRARNVIIATGQGIPNIPAIPGVHHPSIVHSHFVNVRAREWNNGNQQRILIVGGGLTAATLAVSLAGKGHRVDIAMREEMKVYPFDFPPEWFEWDLYWKFRRLATAQDRADMLKTNTWGGSITPEYAKRLEDLPTVSIWESVTVREFAHMPSGGIIPVWDDGYIHLKPFDRVILATGYDPNIYRLAFLKPLFPKIYHIDRFPILANTLEATDGLFFSGALARLGIGAAAPNVYGADLAGRIILEELIRKRAIAW